MNEQIINGTRVVFRDSIPAKFGWNLILPMNKLSEATVAKRQAIIDAAGENLPESIGAISAVDMIGILQNSLSWQNIVALVRGAVQEWGFDGDLSTDKCCDSLDTLAELIPLISRARAIYFGIDLSGEAAGGSTNT